ncbi:MAG: lipopolysaccharide transport periplasmic protein LptA [Thermodesulfovibrionales bacterium]
MRRSVLVAAILVTVVLWGSMRVLAQERTQSASPIEITAQSMIADNKSNSITFEGSVVAQKDAVTMYADRMIVRYDNARKVQSIFAEHSVRLVQAAKEIRADSAVYNANDESVVFTGNPVFSEGPDTVTGTKITYFISDDRSVVENSRVILHGK